MLMLPEGQQEWVKRKSVRDGEIANTKWCIRALAMASWENTVSYLVRPHGIICTEWSIKEKGGGVNVLAPFHLRSHFGQSRPPTGVIAPLQPGLVPKTSPGITGEVTALPRSGGRKQKPCEPGWAGLTLVAAPQLLLCVAMEAMPEMVLTPGEVNTTRTLPVASSLEASEANPGKHIK